VRAEAAYQLTSLAARPATAPTSRNLPTTHVDRSVERLAQRAMSLRAMFPAVPAPAAPAATKTDDKKDVAAPAAGVQVKVPGK